MVETLAAEDDSQPLVEVPLFVFNQSSSLMSDRATQAMEKALRNLANPMEANVTNIKHEKDRVINEVRINFSLHRLFTINPSLMRI